MTAMHITRQNAFGAGELVPDDARHFLFELPEACAVFGREKHRLAAGLHFYDFARCGRGRVDLVEDVNRGTFSDLFEHGLVFAGEAGRRVEYHEDEAR